MPLLDFPDELLLRIAGHLQLERNLNAFARVNCELYNLLNESLYLQNVRQYRSSALCWAAIHRQEGTAEKSLRQGGAT